MRTDHPRPRLLTSTGLVAIAATLALPAVGSAALITVGALGKVARVSYPQPVDTAFWLTAKAGGASAELPASGLVRVIRMRGCAQPGPGGESPLTQVHFQTLVAGPAGTVKVNVTSGPLDVPVCGHGATPATLTTFVPGNLCAGKGDYVAFNVEGGFGSGFPNGVRYKFFGPAAGAVTDSFTRAGATNNGDTLAGTAHAGVRLLMQVVLGTGHSAGVCG
jgi:hypothetical protein